MYVSFGYVLEFDLYSHSWPGAWTLGFYVTKWKLTLQGIYRPNINAFWQVVVNIWTSRKLEHKNPIFWICTVIWPLAPAPSMNPRILCHEMKSALQGIYGLCMNAFWQVVVKIWTSRKLWHKNPIFWICTTFWHQAPPPGMDLGVWCHEMKANYTRYLWCKYEWFPKSGCQNMDF